MTKRDIAIYLGIDTKTLYNWKSNKPNLYKTVMKGLAYDEIVNLNENVYKKAIYFGGLLLPYRLSFIISLHSIQSQ